ncbi:MAG: hypothetical protein CMM07_25875 [Rhodopirellula sp.]|nr:hypothetical protein [Rhodopirellula sp.]
MHSTSDVHPGAICPKKSRTGGRRTEDAGRDNGGFLKRAFSVATVDLGWPPAQFWTATPKELWAAVERKIEINKVQNGP